MLSMWKDTESFLKSEPKGKTGSQGYSTVPFPGEDNIAPWLYEKTDKTPKREIDIALKRMQEVING